MTQHYITFLSYITFFCVHNNYVSPDDSHCLQISFTKKYLMNKHSHAIVNERENKVRLVLQPYNQWCKWCSIEFRSLLAGDQKSMIFSPLQ